MKPLRLCISHLSVPETKLIQAYFRLYSYDPNFPWEICDAAPFDAILVDSNQSGEQFSGMLEKAIFIGDAQNQKYNLKRPLRSDKLEDLLRKISHDLPAGQNETPLHGISADSEIELNVFRLTGWPPAAVLHRNPMRVKAATMMLRKYMSVEDISRITHWNAADSRVFISILRNLGLLKITPQQSKTAANTPQPVEKKSSHAFLSGMISLFRQKLGLQHAGI